MIRHSLKCAFGRWREGEVAKLVAVPRVSICVPCVTTGTERMQAPDRPGVLARQDALRMRFAGWRRWWAGLRRGSRALAEVPTW